MKFLIVRKNKLDATAPKKNINYEGMNREKFGGYSDIPNDLLCRGLVIEDFSTAEAEMSYRTLLEDLLSVENTEYELLMLGGNPSNEWEFLGYDVGENTAAAWSAILNRNSFLNEQEIAQWEDKLNSHGLFQELREAEAFLAYYLESNDSDMGWTADGWTNTPDWYSTVPIYRYHTNP